jgi:hypothetical protein
VLDSIMGPRPVELIDAAVDRQIDASDARVEEMRAAWIFAHDDKQHRRWRSAVDRRANRSSGLTGEALERAIMSLAVSSPDIVVFDNG